MRSLVFDRTFAGVLLFFVAFYPITLLLGALFENLWDVPVIGEVFAIYFTLAVTLPAALTLPVTELLFNADIYAADTQVALIGNYVILGVSYLVLSILIAGTYRTLRRTVDSI